MVLRFFQFYSQARVTGEDGHVFMLCVFAFFVLLRFLPGVSMGRRGAPVVSSYTNLVLSAKKQLAPPDFVLYQVADANQEYGKVRQPS